MKDFFMTVIQFDGTNCCGALTLILGGGGVKLTSFLSSTGEGGGGGRVPFSPKNYRV